MSTNIPTVIDDMPVYERFGFAFDIDQWYPSCASFTIPTQFIAVSPTQAKIICKLYEYHVRKEQDKALTPEEYEVYKQLETSIDEVLQAHFYNEDDDSAAAFVRMSGRSPKDAVFDTDRIKQVMKRKLYEQKYKLKRMQAAQHDFQSSSSLTSMDMLQNSEFIAFFETQAECMKISSGQEALELIVNSLRVYEDLNAALSYNLEQWSVKIVLRQWVQDHDIGLEFRAFVYKRQLTAISQYFEPLYYPYLTSNKSLYLSLMNKFFDSIKEQLPWDDCVCDFLITKKNQDEEDEGENENNDDDESKTNDDDEEAQGDNEQEAKSTKQATTPSKQAEDEANYSVQVLEFNPFNRFTSAALFDWHTDRDLFEGKKPFEFRVLQRPLPVLRENFAATATAATAGSSAFGGMDEFEGGGNADEMNEAMLLLTMPEMHESIVNEHQNVIKMVKDAMQDDVQRINSNLRYVMQKITKDKLFKLSQPASALHASEDHGENGDTKQLQQ